MKIKKKDIIDYFGVEHLTQTRTLKSYSNKELLEYFIKDITNNNDYALRTIKVI